MNMENDTTVAPEANHSPKGLVVEAIEWGVVLVGLGLSIISHAILHDLGDIPALAPVPGVLWAILGAPVGMLAAHRFAATQKRKHALLVLPMFLILTVANNIIRAAG